MGTPREFVEIQVKSVLNRVQGMPFRWSINPYRGCSHACVFCVSGDTFILMADGTTRRLDEIRIGDQICGTEQHGGYHRYARTFVLAHWSVEKPAYRIMLEDGTELIASGDHRFLTDRGWKFVTGAEHGAMRRPHLTTNNNLLGTGAFATPPAKTTEYKRGAITRKRNIVGQAIKNTCRLRVMAIEPIGVRRLFDITTGTGDFIANGVVSHNCYARRTHWFLDADGIDRWSSKIFVKVNAPEVLRRELARPSWKHEEVALGTATDPYQAIEGKYKITGQILEALRDFRTPVSIVTRSPMIMRDLDLLTELAGRAGVTVCVSIATVDAAIAHEVEPTVAPPAQRLRTVEALSAAGIRTGVLLAPILPGLTDDPKSLEAVIQAAREHKAHFVGHNVLHLGEITRDAFFRYLRARHPRLVPRYEHMYRGKYAPNAYRADIARIVAKHKARIRIAEPRYLRPAREPEQLSLLDGS